MSPEEHTPPQEPQKRKPVGNLTDFIEGSDGKTPVDIEVAVQNDGKVAVFHNRRFKVPIAWYEFDLNNSSLEFVMDGGETRNAGMKIHPKIAKNMQNSHQILTILMDDDSGEALEGHYIPLIIHRD